MRHEAKSLMEIFTSIAEHTCEGRTITVKDEQGTDINNTFMGFECSCGEHFVLALSYVKCMPKPLRPFLTNKVDRHETARRFTAEPKIILSEMVNSGGWFQPDPGVMMMTAMAAAMGPEGNPMQRRLKAMVEGKPRP